MSNATTKGRLAFDIETQPNAHRLHLLPEPEVALGNLKDPAKIDEKVAHAKRNLIDRAALDANFGRVVCISVGTRQASNAVNVITAVRQAAVDPSNEAEANENERQLIKWFWEQAAAWGRFATFNGSGFDVPFLLRRSLLLGLRPYKIDCHPYRVIDPDSEHLDVCKLLHDYESGNGTGYTRNLHFYAGLILNEQPTYGADLDKGSIGRMYDAGQHDQICEVCRWDCDATLRLAEAVSRVYC